jgi:hypothetical protein
MGRLKIFINYLRLDRRNIQKERSESFKEKCGNSEGCREEPRTKKIQ